MRVTTCDDEVRPDESASANGVESRVSTSLSAAVNKKINLFIQNSAEKKASLDFQKCITEGKQGVHRHQVHLFIKAADVDVHKKTLDELVDLKSTYKLFVKTEIISPENIHETQTIEISNTIGMLLKAGKPVPSPPYVVLVVRHSEASSKTAHIDEEKCHAFIIICFPYWTIFHDKYLGEAKKVFDVMTAVHNCTSPLSTLERLEVWDGCFLDQFFCPLLSVQTNEVLIITVCELVDKYVSHVVEHNEELEDNEAALLNEYSTIMKVVPKFFKTQELLTETFWETINELMEFSQNLEHNKMRFRKVSTALQEHQKVQTTLADINCTLLNRAVIEEPLSKITTMFASMLEHLGFVGEPPAAGGAISVEAKALPIPLFTLTVDALGCMQFVQAHIGNTFSSGVETKIKAAVGGLIDTVRNAVHLDDVSARPDKELLNSCQQVISECNVIWPFGASFEDAKEDIGSAIRSLTLEQDLESLSTVASDMLKNATTDSAIELTIENVRDFKPKMLAVEKTKIDVELRAQFCVAHHGTVH